ALNKIKEDIDMIRELNSSIRTIPQRLVLLENACNACALNTLTSSHDKLSHYALSRKQWATLDKVVKFLEPFKDLIAKIAFSANSTVFWIIPLFNIILNYVEDVASVEEIE
ncbi:3375_t:CDS:2, partial [Gigaspora rosea]